MATKASGKPKSAGGAAEKAQTPLVASEIYARIRPAVWDGSGHDQDGEGVAKTLTSWSNESLTLNTEYLFSDGVTEYKFPRRVLGPEVTQGDVFDGAQVGDSVNSFVSGMNDTIFLAYGQTGTGKTHTIFGTEPSLRGEHQSVHADWGVFPRVAFSALEALQAAGTKYSLGISAVEFYNCQCLDLLAARKTQVVIDENHRLTGHTVLPLAKTSDIFPAVNTVVNNRTSRGTNMNQAQGDHGGSSRSHCALVLTMLRVDEGGDLRKATFTLMDLAGAERPSKTREQEVGGAGNKVEGGASMLVFNASRNGPENLADLSVADQGRIINYELFELGKEIGLATNKHRRRLPYKAPTQNTTPFMQFTGSMLDGSCLCKMMICLSQAPQCGWETWWSLCYGTTMSKLKAPVVARSRGSKLEGMVKKGNDNLQAAMKNTEVLPTEGTPAAKFNFKKIAMLRQAQVQADMLATITR
jgi:hypothetical protein